MSTQGQWRGDVDGDWFGDVGSGSIVNLSAVLTGAGNVSANVSVIGASTSGGYFEPHTRRRTKKEAYRERELLRLKIQDVEEVAEQVVEKKLDAMVGQTVDSRIDVNPSRPDVDYLVNQLMAQLRLTVKVPDYTRAIQAALVAKKQKDAKRLQDEEDEEALLLFM